MIVIQIVDWRSYLLRSDIKKHKAFKLSTGLLTSPKMWSVSPQAKLLFVILLDLACQGDEYGCIRQTADCLILTSGINKESLKTSLEELETIKLIQICSESVLNPCEKNTEKTRRKYVKKTEVIDLTDDELELGRKWLEMAVSEMPHRANDPKWHAAEFGTELKKVGQAVGLDHAGMLKLFHYVSADTFWRPNACSPKGLLVVNKNGVRKIDNILTRMKKPAERLADIREEQRADTTRPLNEDGVTTDDVQYWFRNK
jgi:hypothetical protein